MYAYDYGFAVRCGCLLRDESSARRERRDMIGHPKLSRV